MASSHLRKSWLLHVHSGGLEIFGHIEGHSTSKKASLLASFLILTLLLGKQNARYHHALFSKKEKPNELHSATVATTS
jgi:hypothetical protein